MDSFYWNGKRNKLCSRRDETSSDVSKISRSRLKSSSEGSQNIWVHESFIAMLFLSEKRRWAIDLVNDTLTSSLMKGNWLKQISSLPAVASCKVSRVHHSSWWHSSSHGSKWFSHERESASDHCWWYSSQSNHRWESETIVWSIKRLDVWTTARLINCSSVLV